MNLVIAAMAVLAAALNPSAEKGASPTGAVIRTTAKISSKSAYYDHKEGFAYLSGRVHVDDAEYQLHADRAYVFTDGTNELTRIVALGHVALTNGLRSASGDKASYYRRTGMVVLKSSAEEPAEVRERTNDGDRIVRGKKIKFWVGTRQVEIEEAWISGQRPVGASDKGIRDIFGR